ncbi:TOBE domain-containing protein [Mannheimia sp. AT1]|uniref:TOBE domain-containing protein n=1 Tax=Mannheimia cairinae TaxID=3025936 RepID=A0ABT5MSZ8_9PAST|nr:TOBE domain-containing protein [Mannheimia cairinae]MDD0824586.1 TOBE domain-containing protein [Mannheimia cairinae]MDD0826485.1 TOBE domain-containing protein [Mannheimia cairinae]
MLNAEILLTIKLNQQLFADPRRVELLRQIKKIGSINQAAKLAGVSYKTAWDNIDAMNKLSPKPLLERNIGGKQGGGTCLTLYAERLLQLYELLKQTQERAFAILHNEDIPLDNLLVATAYSALQTSARNQFFGKVSSVKRDGVHAIIGIEIEGIDKEIMAKITLKSCERLNLSLGREVMLMIKAPWVELQPSSSGENNFVGKIKSFNQQNGQNEIIVQVNNVTFCATTSEHFLPQINDDITIHIEPEQIILATL